MAEIFPVERMRIIFIFLDFLTFTLLWNLYDVCGEPSGLMELYDCINGTWIMSKVYKTYVQVVGSRVISVFEFWPRVPQVQFCSFS